MGNIIKKNSSMPALPQMFQSIAPPPLPAVPYNGGIVERFMSKWKLKDIRDCHQSMADIAEAQLRQTKAVSAGMMEAATFGLRLRYEMERIDHERSMMKHVEMKAQAEASNAYFEARITEMDFRLREREYKKLLKEEENEGSNVE